VNAELWLLGCAQIARVLATVFLLASYLVVSSVLLPITKKQQLRRKDFNTFLTNGFLDIDHLESAIIRQNPSMTKEETYTIKQDIARYLEFINNCETSADLVPEMVICNVEDIPFRGFSNLRMGQA
jgi:hypothetical protein